MPSPRPVLRAAAVVGALALLAGCTGQPAREHDRFADRDGAPPRAAQRAHAVTAPRGDRDAAALHLLSGVTAVTVRVADLGEDLYRIRTPDDSQVAPVAEGADPVRVLVESTGLAGPALIDITLARGVRWDLRFSGGAQDQVVDLRGGAVSAVSFAAGATRIDLSLPEPSGLVPVRMTGGASEFRVHAPAGVPVRVRLGGGAGSVTVDGTSRSGVSDGDVIEPGGWAAAADRYDVDATAGVSSLVLDRTA
jgi:hypothetical protein